MTKKTSTGVAPTESGREEGAIAAPPFARHVPASLADDFSSLIENNAKLADASANAFFERLFGYKNIETALIIQSELTRTHFEGYLAQATKIAELYSAMTAYSGSDQSAPRSDPDDAPSDEQWADLKHAAMAHAGAGLRSPEEHLAFIREQIAKVAPPDVE